MRLVLLVGAGSFIGGICRYLLSTFIQAKSGAPFPYGTLLVNLTGCLIIGCLYSVFEKGALSNEAKLLLLTGVLGGFTTFSAFSVETFVLIREGRFISTFIYLLLSVAGGLGLTAFGAWIFKLMLR